MGRLAVVALAASVAACTRDTSLPPPPGPGSIQGRVVYAVAGQTARVAAAGARVTVLGTSVGATAGPDGRFVVANPTLTDGQLLVQVDLNGDGVPDRQTLLSLAALGAQPGRDLALGDVVVVENARVRGRALRADVTGTTGHGGIVVFVPQGPFTTLTGDDGSYLFENLPEGRLSLTYFKDGYDPQGIDGVQLGAGQDFTVRDVVLARSPPPPSGSPAPGAISGQVVLTPAASADGERVLATQLVPDPTFSASTSPSAAGAFRLASLRPGLYRLEASRPGYVTAVVSNVMLGAGAELQLGVSLAAQGVSADPVSLGTTPTCVAGARCNLPNACQIGQVNCATGSPVCAPAGNALDGIPCGTNQVCSAGACVSVCVAGASCRPPADPCREGVVSCATGTPTCVAGTAPLANGTACGLNQVCNAGACTTCFASLACTPTNPCDSGLTGCGTGTQTCRDTGLAVADGTFCGSTASSLYCAAGVCGACQPGKACTPAGFPCHGGSTSCATGREVCVDTGAVAVDGTSCGTNQVCHTGACLACTAGAACTPANPCHAGAIACGTGLPVCVDQQTNLAAGVGCGSDHVCSGAGTCVACVQGQACAPTNGCHAGGIQCATGAPVCGDLAVSLTNGTACGTNQVCLSGTCVACTAGASCTPTNPCHYGATACATGVAVCGDTSVPLANGATCGTNLVCSGGACVACATGAACDGAAGHAPAPTTLDPCKVYVTACASGTPACDGTQSRPDGTACGSSLVCRSGSCQTSSLTIQLAGDQQHALPNQPLAQLLSVTIRSVLTATGVAGQTVSVAPPPGAQVDRATATTDPTGVATFTLTLGRAVGPQDFVVRHDPSYPPTTAAREWADAPATGTVIPLVNAARATAGPATGPGPAVRAPSPMGVAVASTGDVYVSDYYACNVRRISPAGVVSVIAGGAACNFVGDTGLALNAALNSPRGLALDEVNQILYVADSGNNRVRAVWLSSGLIDTVAGGGTGLVAPYGDLGPARGAQLSQPTSVALGPERPYPSLYVLDFGQGRLRRVDGTTGIITTVAQLGSCGDPVAWNYAGSGASASVAVDRRGDVFFSGRFCGSTISGMPFGIARLRRDGTLALVAGSTTGGLASGSALGAYLGNYYPATLAVDDAVDALGTTRSNVYFAVFDQQALGRIDGATGRLDVLAGTVGSAASTGDFGPASAARLNQPTWLATTPWGRDLYFPEYAGQTVRTIAGAASTTASTASLAASPPASQAAYADQIPGSPISVTLRDGAGQLLGGYPVSFATDPAGLPGGSVTSASASTSLAGTAAVTARPGLAAGTYRFLASFLDLHGNHVAGSPVPFAVAASAPPAGTVFTVVNDAHANGNAGIPGPGSRVQTPATYGADLLPDGGLAFVANSAVLRLDPSGVVSVLAGKPGASGYSGDGGPATAATLVGPYYVAVDRGRRKLYVADTNGHRIRAVDLSTGFISTLVGNGTATSTGDGGLASAATTNGPSRPRVAGGSLLFQDASNRIRRVGVDPTNLAEYGYVFPYLQPGATAAGQTTGLSACSAGAPFQYDGINPGNWWGTGAIAVDPSGAVYVAGMFCGGPFGATYDYGIARVDPGTGALSLVAGAPTGGPPATGQALGAMKVSSSTSLAFDGAGRLWIALRSSTANANYLGWVAPAAASGRVDSTSTWNAVGQSTTPSVPPANDYSPAAGYWFGSAFELVFDAGGHLYFTDASEVSAYQSYSVRVLW